jgi:hypothetical protein
MLTHSFLTLTLTLTLTTTVKYVSKLLGLFALMASKNKCNNCVGDVSCHKTTGSDVAGDVAT